MGATNSLLLRSSGDYLGLVCRLLRATLHKGFDPRTQSGMQMQRNYSLASNSKATSLAIRKRSCMQLCLLEARQRDTHSRPTQSFALASGRYYTFSYIYTSSSPGSLPAVVSSPALGIFVPAKVWRIPTVIVCPPVHLGVALSLGLPS